MSNRYIIKASAAIASGGTFGRIVSGVLGRIFGSEEEIAFLPDVELSGGRSGGNTPQLQGPANSYVRGGGGRVFQTNESGKIVRDITSDRVKVLEINRAPNGQTFERFRKIGQPSEQDLDVLRRMGVIK